jgi:hypothetical protein
LKNKWKVLGVRSDDEQSKINDGRRFLLSLDTACSLITFVHFDGRVRERKPSRRVDI